MLRLGLVLAAIVLVTGCGGSKASHDDAPKATCEKANKIQQMASSNEAAMLNGDLEAIAKVGGAVTGALNGAKQGTPIATDLTVVENDMQRIHHDALNDKRNLAGDVATLKSTLIRLGMDCSKYLG